MRRFPPTQRKRPRIEIIPMIDVMMFLLVFFVLISINVIPALGLKMRLPVSAEARDTHPPVKVVVTVPEDGPLQLDGHDVATLDALGDALVQRKQAAPQGLTVFINGDSAVRLQRLVDVMGVLKARGIEAMTLSARHS